MKPILIVFLVVLSAFSIASVHCTAQGKYDDWLYTEVVMSGNRVANFTCEWTQRGVQPSINFHCCDFHNIPNSEGYSRAVLKYRVAHTVTQQLTQEFSKEGRSRVTWECLNAWYDLVDRLSAERHLEG